MTRLLKTVCLITLVFPASLEASTYISEIAWMGSSASANHEWIELHNSGGSSIDVTGFTISDGLNLVINLTGSIPPNTYVVVERSSDASAPGPAFLTYTGALVNTGATLTLRNKVGEIIDQVAGGENWAQIGGDNTTKATAQYTSGGWGSGAPTPQAANVLSQPEEEVPIPEEETGTSTEAEVENDEKSAPAVQKTKSNSNKSATVLLRDNGSELVVKPEFQKVAYVNQKIFFKAVPSGLGKNILASLKHSWNFGDSFTASGKEVEHSYRYPGNYVVTIFSEFGDNQAVERAEITVLPVTFSISKSLLGDIQLNNDAGYDIDISGYQLIGTESVVMPPRTVMLAKSTITIDKERLGAVTGTSLVALYDQKQNLVATLNSSRSNLPLVPEAELTVGISTESDQPVATIKNKNTPTVSGFSFLKSTTAGEVVNTAEATAATTTTKEILINPSAEESLIRPDETSETKEWPYVLLIGLLLMSFLALLYGRPSSREIK